MSDRRIPDSPQEPKPKSEEAAGKSGSDPLELIEQCLALFSETDSRQKLLYKLRHAVMLSQAANQQREVEFKKVSDEVAKLTAPANRGILCQCGSSCGRRRSQDRHSDSRERGLCGHQDAGL
jgi:proteasome-associated ATPase